MKKKVLFVTFDTGVGGVMSSLSSLYDYIQDDYDISMLSLTRIKGAKVSYTSSILYTSILMHAYYCTFATASLYLKPLVGVMKVICKISQKLSFDFEGRFTS